MQHEYTIRVISRAIIINDTKDKVLLVKNKNADFWYPPGGGWEPDRETVQECVIREVYEEVGVNISIVNLAYVQEFRNQDKLKAMVELFWLCTVNSYDSNHKQDLDPNGMVETYKWFTKEDLKDITIFPEILKASFWEDCDEIEKTRTVFLM